MRKMFFVTMAILLLTMSNYLFAQNTSEIWIKVSDDIGSAPYTMLYGNGVGATYGVAAQKDSLNPTIIERESPPLPPGLGVVWKPSRAGVNWGNGFLTYDFKEFVNDTQKDTFKIYFNQGQDSFADITLEWPDATYLGLRCTGMTIKFGADVIDMFAQTSYTVVDAGEIPLNTATIIKTGCFMIDDVKLEKSTVPAGFQLNQNFPNPFNPSTTITFDVLKSSNVDVSVYNVLGQKVASLVSRDLNAGSYSTNWNAASYSSGVYYVRMTAKENGVEQFSSLRKLLFVK